MTARLSAEVAAELESRIAEIIGRLQKIQQAIRSTAQPVSRLELETLKSLGEEYAKLVEKLNGTD